MKIVNFNGKPEIFKSIQGEGRNIGQISVFIRASLCNLQCVWCDTDYTWNWKGTSFRHIKDSDPNYKKHNKDEQILEMSPDEIAVFVRSIGVMNIVITGGEPLLQQDDFLKFMQILDAGDGRYRFEIETNGTIIPSSDFDGLTAQYNVSPKLANSGNKIKNRCRSDALNFFATSRKAWFKFVCSSIDDLSEIESIVERFSIHRDRVFIMPEGVCSQHISDVSKLIIDECISRGFGFSDRLHVHLFSNKRGT